MKKTITKKSKNFKFRLTYPVYYQSDMSVDGIYDIGTDEFEARTQKEAIEKARRHLENPGNGIRVLNGDKRKAILVQIIQEERVKNIPLS